MELLLYAAVQFCTVYLGTFLGLSAAYRRRDAIVQAQMAAHRQAMVSDLERAFPGKVVGGKLPTGDDDAA